MTAASSFFQRYAKGFGSKCPIPGPAHTAAATRDGSVWGYQYRPDEPRVTKSSTYIKYETPKGPAQQHRHPGLQSRRRIGDPSVPLWVTEGSRKADSGSLGRPGVRLAGAACGAGGAGTPAAASSPCLPPHDVALDEAPASVILAFDSDAVQEAGRPARPSPSSAATWESKGARAEYLHLLDPDDGKCGLDDYLAAHGADGLMGLVRPESARRATDARSGCQGVRYKRYKRDGPGALDGDLGRAAR